MSEDIKEYKESLRQEAVKLLTKIKRYNYIKKRIGLNELQLMDYKWTFRNLRSVAYRAMKAETCDIKQLND